MEKLNEKQQEINPKIDLSKIPSHVLGVELSEENREKLSKGEWSDLIIGMKTGDGKQKNGKVKVIENDDGELDYQFIFQKEKLLIPERIGNHELSFEDKKKLEQGQNVLIKYEGKDIYIKIDKQLNSITISSGKEIGVPKEIGGYKLTDKDKQDLAEGKTLKPKVFKGKQHFVANVRIADDGCGLVYTNIRTITNDMEAAKLIDKLNVSSGNEISSIPRNSKVQEQEVTPESNQMENVAVSMSAEQSSEKVKDKSQTIKPEKETPNVSNKHREIEVDPMLGNKSQKEKRRGNNTGGNLIRTAFGEL